MTDKKKVQRIAAGDVIAIMYQSENRPCDKCMAITLTPLTVREDGRLSIGQFYTLCAIDLETEQFITDAPIVNVTANIGKVTDRKTKKWYYERVLALNKEREEREKQQ